MNEKQISIYIRKRIYEFCEGDKDYIWHKSQLWFILNQIKYYSLMYNRNNRFNLSKSKFILEQTNFKKYLFY